MYAPVVMFCYTRLNYLKKTVSALKKNPEARDTELYIYSDGGKDDATWEKVRIVREYLKTITGFRKITIVEQPENKRLEFNVIQGVTETVNRCGKVIVLEDDVLPSRSFLKYMNDALTFYENRKEVMCILGYNFLNFPKDFPETFAWRHDSSWGWATWKDRWGKYKYYHTKDEASADLSEKDREELECHGAFGCLSTLDLRPIPWDVCWYICVYRNGVGISPTHSVVKHIGEDGTHFSNTRTWFEKLKWHPLFPPVGFSNRKVKFFNPDTSRNMIAEKKFEQYHRNYGMYQMTRFGRVWNSLSLWTALIIKWSLPYGVVRFMQKRKQR